MRRLLAVGLVAIFLGGCGVFPMPPGPYPTDIYPSITPKASVDGSLLSPDGFDAAQRITVRVRNIGCQSLSTGTGFAIDEHTLVTAAHVVEGSRQLEISTYDGTTLDATATGTTTVADLAIVHVEESLATHGILAETDAAVGGAVTIVGYPGGGRLTTTNAIIIATAPEDVDPAIGPAFGVTAALEPGMSGAPVVDSEGQVVGVIYGTSTALPQSFMIPVSTIRNLLEELPALIPEATSC